MPNNTDICVVSCGIYHGYRPEGDIRGICHRIQRRYPCYRHKYCIISGADVCIMCHVEQTLVKKGFLAHHLSELYRTPFEEGRWDTNRGMTPPQGGSTPRMSYEGHDMTISATCTCLFKRPHLGIPCTTIPIWSFGTWQQNSAWNFGKSNTLWQVLALTTSSAGHLARRHKGNEHIVVWVRGYQHLGP